MLVRHGVLAPIAKPVPGVEGMDARLPTVRGRARERNREKSLAPWTTINGRTQLLNGVTDGVLLGQLRYGAGQFAGHGR